MTSDRGEDAVGNRRVRWMARGALIALLAASFAAVAPSPPAGADGNEAPGNPAVFRQLSAGGAHTCAIVTDGSVRCWGNNSFGRLGLGDTADRGDGPGEMGGLLPAVDLGTGRTATSVSAGQLHSCALLDNDTVKCWGGNASGSLGLGNNLDRGDDPNEMGDNLPAVDLGTGRTATAISTGNGFACALLDNASVKCWGQNHTGQLGLGNTLLRGDQGNEMGDNLPAVDLGNGRTATAITAGGTHTCALLDNATVKCWGANGSGQLGLGDTTARGDGANEMGNNLPAVNLGTGRTAVALSAGGAHTCAVLDNGSAKCWGTNAHGALGQGHTVNRGDGANEMGDDLPAIDVGVGRTATAITAGSSAGPSTCALLDNGGVKCWGFNANGDLGLGDTSSRGDAANEMGSNLPFVSLGTTRTATAVTAGSNYACAMLDLGTIKCWGFNQFGQLGQGDNANRGDGPGEMGNHLPPVALTPTGTISGTVTEAGSGDPVANAFLAVLRANDFSLAGSAAADTGGVYRTTGVAPGNYFLYVIDPTGDRPAGISPQTPTVVTDGASAAANPTLAATRGSISGTMTDDATGDPVTGGLAIAINAAGAITGGAVTAPDGSYRIPRLVPGDYRTTYLDFVGGRTQEYFDDSPDYFGASDIAVTAGGDVDATDVAMQDPVTERSISAGGSNSCAVLANGSVKCWGGNANGRLGLGDTANRGDGAGEMGASLPAVNLGTGRTAVQVATGNGHTCALLDNATVKCWGLNSSGQLGLGDTASRGDGPGEMGDSLPAVNLGTGRSATAITTGGAFTCALLDNATVKCWGFNSSGQLGQGDAANRGDGANEMGDNLAAINLGTGRTAAAISANGTETCAILDNGGLKCWGNNQNGRLGLGDTANRGDGANEMGNNLPAINLGSGRTAVAVSVGGTHVCAILDDSTLKCWGAGVTGVLGQGTNVDLGDAAAEMGNNLPAIDLGTGRTPRSIASGNGHACAVLDDATLRCWGANTNGGLGLGNTTNRGDNAGEMGDNLPGVNLGTDRTASLVTTGNLGTCAQLDDTSIRCWGLNTSGQLGRGNTTAIGDGAGEMGDDLGAVSLSPAGVVTGTMTDALTSLPVPGAWGVLLRSSDFSPAAAVVANGSGDFVTSAPIGNYFLYLIDPGNEHALGFFGAPTLITVTDGAVNDIDPVLTPTGGALAGTVLTEVGDFPALGAWIFAIGPTGVAGVALAEDDGDYLIDGLPAGTYRAAFLDPLGGGVLEYHDDSPDFEGATPFNIIAAATTTVDAALAYP